MAEVLEIENSEGEMTAKEGGLGSEISYFVDEEAVLVAIGAICADEKEFDAQFAWLDPALSKYQEQPVLLQAALPDMINPLTRKMLEIIEMEKDSGWNAIIGNKHFDGCCRVVQLICRVRGYKHVLKLFPHEVSHLEPTLTILGRYNEKKRTGDFNAAAQWETKFVMLLWLCIQCLIPFDICSMDSSSSSNTVSDAGAGIEEGSAATEQSLVARIVQTCEEFLADTGPTRDAASACLSSLLTRPDMDSGILTTFIDNSCAKLHSWAAKGTTAATELTMSSFEIIGVLHCIAQIFKKGHRSRVLSHASKILKECLLLAEQPNQTSVRKLTCKVTQRLGMAFLPPRVAPWRYQRGSRSLTENLGGKDKLTNSNNNQSMGDGIDPVATDSTNPCELGAGDLVELERFVDDIESVIDLLLKYLTDKDTVVRWNAAKGVGRITMRLPRELADDVVGAVFALFADEEDDSAWHGGSLALAELTRRGLLLPERLEEVMPILVKAINFDVLRGQHSVGSHVRDAACYVCWAFARAYSPDVMAPFIADLSSSMLITALYDREINCRRAASAAFQENVGRQGNESFPRGIAIITIADYFSLGNRASAYLDIAPEIAKMDDNYQEMLLWHLLDVKSCHWDQEIRVLAAKGMARLASINVTRSLEALDAALESCFDSNLSVRHGSLLVVAEMVLEMRLRPACAGCMDEALVEKIVSLVPRLDKARMFRGRGGEILRAASCQLIGSIARADMATPVKNKVLLIEFLNENIRHPHDYIQQAAADALREALFSFFARGGICAEDPTERLQELTVLKYAKGLSEEENVAAARGYALALGVLPEKLLLRPAGRLNMILSKLVDAASIAHKICGEPDAECRRNCVTSTVEIVERLALSAELEEQHIKTAMGVLLAASRDHSVDKRGDTGSWSRIVALLGMERVVYALQSRKGLMESQGDGVVMTALGPALKVNTSQSFESVYTAVAYTPCSLGHTFADAAAHAVGNAKVKSEASAGDDPTAHLVVASLAMALPPPKSGLFAENSASTAPVDSEQVVCVMLTQLCEKLDAVREVAGKCLVRLLRTPESNKMHMRDLPERHVLFDSLVATASGKVDQSVNWAHPAHVFPRLLPVLSSPVYFRAVMSGLVIAVGGLSETIVRESTKIVLQFTKVASTQQLVALADCLLSLMREHAGDDRMAVPLLKTLLLLLRNGVFESNIFECPGIKGISGGTSVAQQLLELSHAEHTSTNVVKIRLCVDMFLQLLLYCEPVRGKAYKYIVICLGHKYPRVRKYAAEQLYLQLLSDRVGVGKVTSEELDAAAVQALSLGSCQRDSDEVRILSGLAPSQAVLEAAQELLVTTAWDGPVSDARGMRQKFCDTVGLVMGKKAADPSQGKENKPKRQDELDSYAALVAEAGY